MGIWLTENWERLGKELLWVAYRLLICLSFVHTGNEHIWDPLAGKDGPSAME